MNCVHSRILHLDFEFYLNFRGANSIGLTEYYKANPQDDIGQFAKIPAITGVPPDDGTRVTCDD